MKKILLSVIVSAMAATAFAGTYKLTESEQNQITEEAEDWIDDMPIGIQDRLSDAVDHAMRGFYSEINSFRNSKDTTDIGKYSVVVKDINGGGLSNINMRLYLAPGLENKAQPCLVFFHAGGWSLGSLDTSDRFCRALASVGNVKVISVAYPLAPEHPYPEALKLCKEAVELVFANAKDYGINPESISLGGDGAGGNLALSTFQNLSESESVKTLVMYYPLLNTTGTLNKDSQRKFGRGYGFDSRLWESFVNAYGAQKTEISKPLPASLVILAGRDIIVEDVKEFASANSQVELVEFAGALHGFVSDGQQKTAFDKAVEITDEFLLNN